MNGIGKIDTQTLLLIGAAGVAVYMITKKPAQYMPQQYPGQYPAPYGQMSAAQLVASQQAQGNTTAGIISSVGTAAGALLQGISSFFG